jgi:hypothetical protein
MTFMGKQAGGGVEGGSQKVVSDEKASCRAVEGPHQLGSVVLGNPSQILNIWTYDGRTNSLSPLVATAEGAHSSF